MDKAPYYEYLLVMPDGDCKGFNDLNEAKAFINYYYERRIDDDINDETNDQTDIGGRATREKVCTMLGVQEGRCEVYLMEDFIKKLQEEIVFDNEKKEVIDKLYEENLDINVYDYNLDLILSDTEIIDMMEPYGEKN